MKLKVIRTSSGQLSLSGYVSRDLVTAYVKYPGQARGAITRLHLWVDSEPRILPLVRSFFAWQEPPTNPITLVKLLHARPAAVSLGGLVFRVPAERIRAGLFDWVGCSCFAGDRPPEQRRIWFMPQGTIKKIISDRGFGFIAGERGEVFFHMSSVEGAQFDDLQEGQAVEYELDTGDDSSRGRNKGPRASQVRPT